MYLNENLQICLLAVQNRYSQHTIDFDNEIIPFPDGEAKDWTAQELLIFFRETIPHLLQSPAHLNIDESHSEMYLLLHSKKKPAFYIHCRGKIPVHHNRERNYEGAWTIGGH